MYAAHCTLKSQVPEKVATHLQALMLAASVDGVAAIQLLLKHGATIELQVRLSLQKCQSTSPGYICHL